MRKFLFVLFLIVCSGCWGQKYSVRRNYNQTNEINDSICMRHISLAGNLLTKSANLQLGAIGLGVISSVATSLYVADDEKRKALLTVGIVSSLGAAVCEIVSISCKLKAGKELKLSAGELVFKF